jgi:hypothetical protein
MGRKMLQPVCSASPILLTDQSRRTGSAETKTFVLNRKWKLSTASTVSLSTITKDFKNRYRILKKTLISFSFETPLGDEEQ